MVCLSRYTRIEEELNDIRHYAEELEPGALDEGINRRIKIFNDDVSMLANDLRIFQQYVLSVLCPCIFFELTIHLALVP